MSKLQRRVYNALFELFFHPDNDGQHITTSKIAEATGIKTDSVRRVLLDLCRGGVVELKKRWYGDRPRFRPAWEPGRDG